MKKIKLLLIIIILYGCSNTKKTEKYEQSFLAFDTYISVILYVDNQKEFDKYYKEVETKFNDYHKLFDKFNNYDNINNLKTINDNAGIKAVVVDKELLTLIKDSKKYYNLTYQKNNINFGSVISIYQELMDKYDNGDNITLPNQELLKQANLCSSMDDVIVNEQDSSIYLKQTCNKLDLGSVAKGYVVDKISKDLSKEGIKSGLINGGGNVAVIGNKPNKSAFKVGIANPNDPSTYQLILSTSATNIVTSGDYQRFFMIGDTKYHHIIDPATLYPATINKSVSIIMDDGFLADYFSTACFMLNTKQIKALAQEYKFEYIIIDKQDKLVISDGLKDKVSVE